MNIKTCPKCGARSIAFFSKVRNVVDDEGIFCKECGSEVYVSGVLRYLIMVVSTANVIFWFPYFWGKIGFLYSIICACLAGALVMFLLSNVCPVSLKQNKQSGAD